MYRKLIVGSGASQIIAGLTVLILAKLYFPAELGKYAIYLSIGTIFSIFVNLKMDMAVSMTNDIQIARRDYISGIFFSIILTLIILVPVAALANKGIISIYFLSMPLLAFSMSSISMTQSLLLKFSSVKKLNSLKMVNALSQLFIQLILFSLGIRDSIIYGLLFSSITSTIYSYKVAYSLILPEKGHLRNLIVSVIDNAYQSLIAYRKLIFYTLPASIIGSLSVNLIPLAINYKFSLDAVGSYNTAYRLLGFPMSLIGIAVGQGFLRESSNDIDQLRSRTLELTKKLSHFSSSIFLVFPSLCYIISLYMYPNYSLLTDIIYFMSIYFSLSIITSPISFIPAIIGKNAFSLIFTIIELIFKPASFIFASTSEVNTFLIFSIINLLLSLAYCILVMGFININKRKIFLILAPVALVNMFNIFIYCYIKSY